MIAGAGGTIAYANVQAKKSANSGSNVGLKASAANATINTLGLKQRVSDELANNISTIAQATGMSTTEVTRMVNDLDINDWTVVDTPSGLSSTGSFDYSYAGYDGSVTTYSDPQYVTATISNQTVTFSVPSSAQPYIAKITSSTSS